VAVPTLAQLADFMFGNPASVGLLPPDAARLIKRATELIADHTITAVYSTYADGSPRDSRIISVFQNATCAQVEFWVTGDEEDDIQGPLVGMSVGNQQQQYGSGANRVTPMYLAPRAARLLRTAGLMGASVHDSVAFDDPSFGDPLQEYLTGLGGALT
jgi:hypothetical protein